MFINGSEVQPGTGFDAALNDFLPKFEYINTKQYYDSVAKYAKTTPIGIMLSGVLATILQTNQQYKDFQAVQEGTENRLAVAIRDWNQSITDYNTKLVKFPSNLIAGLFGYTAKANYKSDEGAKDTKVDFSK